MVELIARTPCQALLPLEIGGVVVREEDVGRLTSIMPYRGQHAAVSATLKAAHGIELPAPGRMYEAQCAQAIWFGRGQTMLIGPAPDAALSRDAALTDQSDAWAVVRLHGDSAEDVLARLVPVDLRAASFSCGHTARTRLMHLAASITRLDDRTFRIMVFRSMAMTLVHDLKTAMEGVAARR
ncbi:sarcosine oxidase subunit gamma [Rhodobacteraceae bacterium F11138]|nr:sarcosine oxidase subunit gamma [Rhodobacteraceae bacterium F11138]